MKKKSSTILNEPYSFNEYINVYYELNFQNDVIRPGDLIKFKKK